MIAFLDTVAGVVTSLVAIISAIIGFLVFFKKGFKKMLQKELKPFQAEIEQMASDVTSIKTCNENQMKKIDELLKKQEQCGMTDRHVLRALITGKYYQYCEQKFLPLYEKECVSLLFEDYQALHGNSFVNDLYEKMMALPSDNPIKAE